MIYSVEVYLWGSRIGLLHQNEDESFARFVYDKNFQRSGIELSPFRMPLSGNVYGFPELSGVYAFHGLPGLVADSLPDKFGNAIINQWLASHGREPESFTALERLCYTGSRGMGALEYVPAFDTDIPDSVIDVTEMTKLASDILTGRQSAILNSDEMSKAKLLDIGSSAGGARAKAIIAWNEATNEVKSGQINAGSGFDYWLIKFDGVAGNGDHEVADKRQYTLIEYAYYLMAKDLGIQMSECRIFEKDGFHHFMTKRFDRVSGEKLHMQTLAALSHIDFNVPCLCSYEMYANYAQRLGVNQAEIEQIYKRMVFAVLGMNCDDHVKNFSFLMNRDGKWSLSPAYDITFAFKPDNQWISQHQMTINGKSKEITDEDLIACGKKMGCSSDYCKTIISDTKAVVSNWLIYAERCGILEDRAEEISGQLKQRVANKPREKQVDFEGD